VLADEATPVAQISRAEADARVREAEATYQAQANDAPELREKAMDRLLAARAMRDVAGAA